MVRLNGIQMRQRLNKCVQTYCQNQKRQERKERMKERAKANAEGVDYELAESFHRIQRER